MERISRGEVPAEIWVGSNKESELEYGNRRSAAKYGDGRDHVKVYRVISDANTGDKGVVNFISWDCRGERETAGNRRFDVRWWGDRPGGRFVNADTDWQKFRSVGSL